MSALSVGGGLALQIISQKGQGINVITVIQSRRYRYLSKFFPNCTTQYRTSLKNEILGQLSNLRQSPLLLFYWLADFSYYSLKKSSARSISTPSFSFQSELQKLNVEEIQIVIGNGEFQENGFKGNNQIQIDLDFVNLQGFGLCDFTQSLSELGSSLIVQATYQMGSLNFSRTYKFNKFSSFFMSREKLILNLQSLIIGDLNVLVQNEGCKVILSSLPISSKVSQTSTPGLSEIFLRDTFFGFYLSKFFPRMLKGRQESDWTILFSDHNGSWEMVLNPEGRWFADPHLVRVGKKTIMLVEDFDLCQQKGRISQMILREGRLDPPRVVVERFEHVSFPQTFYYADETWLTVECHESGGVPLYKFDHSKDDWELITTALPERKLVDPLIFQQGHGWFLIATEKALFGDDFYSKLLMFFSEDPISNTWKPFPMNPLMFDNTAGRNGGLFKDSGAWVRVAQENVRGVYGRAISFKKIQRISMKEYAEQHLDFVLPAFPENVSRVHSFTKLGSLMAIDAKFQIVKQC